MMPFKDLSKCCVVITGKVQFAFVWVPRWDVFSCAAKPTWHPKPLHLWDSLQSFTPTVQTVCLTAGTVFKPAESYCNIHFWPSPFFVEVNSHLCGHLVDFCHNIRICLRSSVYVGDMETLNNSLTVLKGFSSLAMNKHFNLLFAKCCTFESCQDNRNVNIKA